MRERTPTDRQSAMIQAAADSAGRTVAAVVHSAAMMTKDGVVVWARPELACLAGEAGAAPLDLPDQPCVVAVTLQGDG